jgi:putative SOS response-associated peptidase YedK
MPVILDLNDYDLWLDPDVQQPDKLHPLLHSYPPESMTYFPVNLRVNNPKHDDPLCLEPLPPDTNRPSLI